MSAEYHEGDIIKTNRTLRVQLAGVHYIDLIDVQNGDLFRHHPKRDNGSLKIEMVKRANDMHTGPKPKAGVILRGRDIKRIWWKRGTIIQVIFADGTRQSAMVLHGDGLWHVLDYNGTFTFDHLVDDARFELKHVA